MNPLDTKIKNFAPIYECCDIIGSKLREIASSGASDRLVRRLRDHHQQLNTHQKSREAGMLILEAADEIDRLKSACNKWSEDELLHPMIHCQTCGQFRCMIHAFGPPPNNQITGA